ncbi:MAG: HEAT repeat domain-containing protein [Myxococcota bacterium]
MLLLIGGLLRAHAQDCPVYDDSGAHLPYSSCGEQSLGTAPVSVEAMVEVVRNPSSATLLIRILEHGQRVECYACVPPLESLLLSSSNPEVRRISAWWLRQRTFAVGAVFTRLQATLVSSDDPVRRARAAEALGELMHADALDPLCQAAQSDVDADVRRAAVLALGRLNHPLGSSSIAEALLDESVIVRRAAIVAAIRVRGFRECGALISALGDGDPEVRMRAGRLIGEYACDEAVDALASVLDSQGSTEVGMAVAYSLGRLAARDVAGARSALSSYSGSDVRVQNAVDMALRMR